MEEDRWQPVPVPRGDGRHDIGDDCRAAIVERLSSEWSRDPDLTPEKARQLAMWAAASVRALLHELGTLHDLQGPASGAPDAAGPSASESTGPSTEYTSGKLRQLPAVDLNALYDSLSVQTMPEGRYDGRAWIHGHPVLGWLASLVWRGKVFTASVKARRYDAPWHAKNRICGMLMFNGSVLPSRKPMRDGREFVIDYPRLGLTDTVRQVSPTLYLGRMQWRRWTVHFTLSQEKSCDI